jgi:NADH-quinone oxidoreductase subunit I
MKIIGEGIFKGLLVTLNHFFSTYTDDFKTKIKGYSKDEIVKNRSSAEASGIFTIQYPEQQIKLPEEARIIPFLVYEWDETGQRKYRCTACGICSKVCPTQCIWITRKKDEITGKPVPQSEGFYIDIDKCMNCGSCAEFCPFDAIKMDHDFEIATLERGVSRIYSKDKLGKPLDYYAKIRPVNFEIEETERRQKAEVNLK